MREPIDIAKKAYAAVYADDGDAPEFDALPKSELYKLLECAEKGGDASPFGKEVEKIVIAEQKAKSGKTADDSVVEPEEKAEAIDGNKAVATEETVELLMKKTKEELLNLAVSRGISVTEDNNKLEIVSAIRQKK